MKKLLHNIRFYVLGGSIAISLGMYLWISAIVPYGIARTALLVEDYGLITLVYLYFTLLAGPLCYTFRSFPFRGKFLKARRALGVGAFYFAFLHTGISLFGQLGGFSGLGFLDTNYLLAVTFGFIALFILSLLAITSFDWAVEKLSFPKWKLLHRLVYLAGILILVHTVMLGTHFSTLSGVVPQITFIALSFLLLLEAPRFDTYLVTVIPISQFGVSFLLTAVILSVAYVSLISPIISTGNDGVSFDIHAAHKQLARLAQQQQQFAVDISKIPGLDGDRNIRYTASMLVDTQNPQPNQDVTVRFRIYNASTGNPVDFFKFIFAKPMHLIVVNSSLTYFQHIHPVQQGQDFVITTQFPQADVYHLYIEYQPYGGIEQQNAFTISVGNVAQYSTATQSADPGITTKTFGPYTVTMNTNGQLSAPAMSFGSQKISFTITDTKTKQPIKTLEPYLASFGHLTMINEATYDFIHVHPFNIIPPKPIDRAGPTVDFLPIGIYGPFKPGVYRTFAEFNPDGHLFTADFTVNVN